LNVLNVATLRKLLYNLASNKDTQLLPLGAGYVVVWS